MREQEVTLKGGYERRPDLVLYLNGLAVDDVPFELRGKREATAVYNNLPDILASGKADRAESAAEEEPVYQAERLRLALAIDRAMREHAPAGWKGDQAKERRPWSSNPAREVRGTRLSTKSESIVSEMRKVRFMRRSSTILALSFSIP